MQSVNLELLNKRMDELGLSPDLRDHLIYLMDAELVDQVCDILQAFAAARSAEEHLLPTSAPAAWADAAAVRVLARVELPTIGKLRLYVSQAIQDEVEWHARANKPASP